MSKIRKQELFKGANGAIVQNAYIDSAVIELGRDGLDLDGLAALYFKSTGGTITVTVLVAPLITDTFFAPTTAITIASAKMAGTYFIDPVELPLCPFTKLRFTETNVAAVTALDATLFFQ